MDEKKIAEHKPLASVTEELDSAIKAIVFDAYGTLVTIRDPRHPYKKLLEALRQGSRAPSEEDGARIMSTACAFAEIPRLLGTTVADAQMVALERDLQAELRSIVLFPEVTDTLTALRQAGFKLAVCSNLAQPYAAPIKKLLPALDAYAWSFEIGAIKPDPKIYRAVAAMLQLESHEILFVGDSIEADYWGPKRIGMRSLHLARDGAAGAGQSITDLSLLCELSLK